MNELSLATGVFSSALDSQSSFLPLQPNSGSSQPFEDTPSPISTNSPSSTRKRSEGVESESNSRESKRFRIETSPGHESQASHSSPSSPAPSSSMSPHLLEPTLSIPNQFSPSYFTHPNSPSEDQTNDYDGVMPMAHRDSLHPSGSISPRSRSINTSRTNTPPEEPPPNTTARSVSPAQSPSPDSQTNGHPPMKAGTPEAPSVSTIDEGSQPKTSVPRSNLANNPYAMYLPNAPLGNPYANPYFFLTGTVTPPGVYTPHPFMHPPPSAASRTTPDKPPQPGKPKRLKSHTVISKSHSIPVVPRDPSGNPMLPLNVGIMTVISLGEVCMREHFHTERYIFPVGYEVTR
jgi:hypothetical protein